MSFSLKQVLVLVGVITIAALFRFVTIYESTLPGTLKRQSNDDVVYYTYAYNLKHHGVYSKSFDGFSPGGSPQPDSYRPPGYPLFLTLFFDQKLDSKGLRNILLAQAALGTLLVLLVAITALRLMPFWPAVGATLLTGLSPHLINSHTVLLTETLFTFALFLPLLLLIPARWAPRFLLPTALVVGLLLGATALIRPTTQYFVLFAVVVGLIALRQRQARRLLLIGACGFLLALSPWMARNAIETGQPFDTTYGNLSIIHGMYPGMMYREDPKSFGFPYRHDPGYLTMGKDTLSTLGAVGNRFLTEPWRHIRWYLFGKPAALFSWDLVSSRLDGGYIYTPSQSPYFERTLFQWSETLMRMLHGLLVGVAVAGGLYTLGRALWFKEEGLDQTPPAVTLASTLLLYFIAVHMVVFPLPRYTIPILPIIYLLAAWFSWRTLRPLFGRGGRKLQDSG